ncbi:hypothetical protein H8R18_07735 [Nanchangia anserum]|uniref:hypothetical protein n=1 Tax=Nanchangia anserum TaxID=2692125 RepID=UPI0018841262|nr:hypothetical protein [Nanchangia anserum]QOX81619.1 hypothetical protein H8R18_07735 [Nanchangia anserum]
MSWSTSTQKFSYLDLKNGSRTWVQGPTVRTGNASSEVYDITFDAWGNAYVLLDFNNWGKMTGEIWRFSASQWQSGGTLSRSNAQQIIQLDPLSNHRGLAWGPDGKLYAARRGAPYLFAIDMHLDQNTGAITGTPTVEKRAITSRVSTALSGARPVTSLMDPANDLAGCAMGKVTNGGSGPKFKLQKSVIDPKTGAVVEPGKAAPNPVSLATSPVTVRYVVSVSNSGSSDGRHEAITDRVTVPTGFTIEDVLLDGKSQGKSGSFTIPAADLASGKVETHEVVLKLHANMDSVNWTQAQTCGAMNGSYGGGFYNQVNMEGDSDGPANNYGCVPTEPPAELKLVKYIRLPGATTDVTADQEPFASDARYFTLGAGLSGGGAQISGSSPISGQIAVDKKVPAGTYQLFEIPNDNSAHTGAYTWGQQWACYDQNGASIGVTGDNQVNVGVNQSVTCEIRNTPPVKGHVVKTPASPIASNPHIGQTIEPNADGTFNAVYDITVTNTSGFTTDLGEVKDHFTVPAGLEWDGTKMAQVTVRNLPSGAQLYGIVQNVSKDDLARSGGTTIVKTIRKVPNNQSVVFRISIPLKLDPGDGVGSGAYAHSETLGTCENLTTDGQRHTSMKSGIANGVDLEHEDLTYSKIAIQDNIACIPVNVPPPFTPELPGLPLTGGGCARDLFILGGLAMAILGGLGLLRSRHQARMARSDDAGDVMP